MPCRVHSVQSSTSMVAPFGQNTFWGPYIRPNIRSYGIKIYGIRSKTAYFCPKHQIYDRIFTVCRMAESLWCNYFNETGLKGVVCTAAAGLLRSCHRDAEHVHYAGTGSGLLCGRGIRRRAVRVLAERIAPLHQPALNGPRWPSGCRAV